MLITCLALWSVDLKLDPRLDADPELVRHIQFIRLLVHENVSHYYHVNFDKASVLLLKPIDSMAEQPDYIRRPPAVPIVHPHVFPVIPPAPFGLTDDLFSALHLRPLFLEHVGNPDLPSTEKQENEGGALDETGGSKPGESSADKLPKKREWKRPPRAYDSLLGGLPGTQQHIEHTRVSI